MIAPFVDALEQSIEEDLEKYTQELNSLHQKVKHLFGINIMRLFIHK